MDRPIIDTIPRLTLADVKSAIRYSVTHREEARLTITDGRGLTYNVAVTMGERNRMVFCWNYQGLTLHCSVEIVEEPSNLGKGSVYYFLCPQTGRKCRKLYLLGLYIASRWAFPHYYYRNLSSGYMKVFDSPYLTDSPPLRKWGKQTYRGKLTPYGRRIKRWEEMSEKGDELCGTLFRRKRTSTH